MYHGFQIVFGMGAVLPDDPRQCLLHALRRALACPHSASLLSPLSPARLAAVIYYSGLIGLPVPCRAEEIHVELTLLSLKQALCLSDFSSSNL